MYSKQLNTINSRSFDNCSGIFVSFCNYIRNCIKMKIHLAIIYNIFRPCVKNFGKTAVNHKLKRRDM